MAIDRNELGALLGAPPARLPDIHVTGITEDSRKVRPGFIFVAVRGEKTDGHEFATRARDAGAVAIMGEQEDIAELAGLPYIETPHARRALGLIAHRIAGDPSRSMRAVGVTGTNGKSSVVHIIRHILDRHEGKVAGFGTLGYWIGAEKLEAPHTTPFGEHLADLFAQARDAGCRAVAMEVSSHALEQERVAGIQFDVGVFTNLTQDHLDYHQSMEEYGRQKARLFAMLEGKDAFAALNADDPAWKIMRDACSAEVITFGKDGDVRAKFIKAEPEQTIFTIASPFGTMEMTSPLLGMHNVSNTLAAFTVCLKMGVPLDVAAAALAEMPNVPGRFEKIDAGQAFTVVVDYAHTDDGLRNVLQAARELTPGRLIAVFGCGGDRDRGKRPKMAAVAAELADFSIVTSDNPRTEPPERIVLDIEVGFQHAGKEKDVDYTVIIDRAAAIEEAMQIAVPGDFVMIAGKGHEDYQILNTGRIHFDDRDVARQLLEAR